MKKSEVKEMMSVFGDMGIVRDFLTEASDSDDFCLNGYRCIHIDEIENAMIEYVKENIWAFSSDFLANYTGIPADIIRTYQEKYYEDANDRLLEMFDGKLEEIASDAATLDGYGHFFNSYDGTEEEITHNGQIYYVFKVY